MFDTSPWLKKIVVYKIKSLRMNVDHYILCYFNMRILFSRNIILALYVKIFVELFCCDCHINGLNGNFIDGNE